MIQIDWQQVLGYLLVGSSGLGALIWGGKAAWTKFRAVQQNAEQKRSADAPAPDGAVDWVSDICEAMGDASAESKLKALQAGATRDQARMLRIAELEAKP